MDSLPSSRLRFLSTQGEPLEVPREWSSAYVEILGATAADLGGDLEVRRQGASLPLSARRLGGEVRVVAEWPLADPGRHRLELVQGSATLEARTVTIAPSKITADEF